MGTSRRKKVFGIGWTWQKKALNTELTYLSTAAIQKKFKVLNATVWLTFTCIWDVLVEP